jgi:hypothetical protein
MHDTATKKPQPDLPAAADVEKTRCYQSYFTLRPREGRATAAM